MAIQIDSSDSNFAVYWPHMEGRIVLAYSPDGQYLYTGGADTLIRCGKTSDPDGESAIIEYFEESITSLHCSFDALVGASENGYTATFSHDPPHALSALITRCDPGSATRCARFGHSGRKIAVTSDELLVKIVDVRDTTDIQLLSGHSRAVRSCGWNPDGSILVTASSDGDLRIWDTSAPEPVCVKTIEGLITPDEPEALPSVEPLWNPNGRFFAIITKSHEIVLISKDDWSQCGHFSHDGHLGEVYQLAWSPNGSYLASAGADEQVIIWETATQTPLYKTKISNGQVTCLAWQPGPGGNSLSIADATGQLTRWDKVIPPETKKPHPSDGPDIAAFTSAARPAGKHARKPSHAADARIRRPVEQQEDEDDAAWIDDDMNGAYKDVPDDDAPEAEESVDPRQGTTLRTPAFLSAGQLAFQPGATADFKNKRRYLAFNHVGLIYTIDHDHQNLIHVEFHDRSTYRGHQFDDNHKFTLASLGERGAAYASPRRDEHASVVHYRPYQSWTSGADWLLELPRGESAVALGVGGAPSMDVDEDLLPALGMGCIVVGTDAGYLRFFGASGLQLHLIDLGEEIVAVSVGREWAFVVHRESGLTADGRQNLKYTILDTDTFEIVQQGSIPMLRQTTLNWIGFTDDQIPALYKSNGVLSLLHRARRPNQARWVPILDTNLLDRREGKQESYWPVSVSADQLHCIILKGEEKTPGFPTPLLQELPLQLPTCAFDSEQGKLEEAFLRDSVIAGHVKDGAAPGDFNAQARLKASAIQMDSSLIKIMQITSKADRLEQALEAARFLSQLQSLDAAAKLAAFFHQPGLQERVLLIKEARSGEDLVDKERRESKWGHLIDNRTLVDSSRLAQDYSSGIDSRSKKASAGAVLSRPVEVVLGRQSFGDSSALASHKPLKPIAQAAKEDSGLGSSEMDEVEESMPFDEAEEAQSPEPEAPAPAAAPAKAAPNPFAKGNKAKPAPVVNSNPFAKKPINNAREVKRSDSFFNRVEAKTQTKPAKDNARQPTLFGKPSAPAPELKKRGRKRKSDADAPATEESPAPAKSADTTLQAKLSFASKPAKAAPKPTEESQNADAEITPSKRTKLDDEGLAPSTAEDLVGTEETVTQLVEETGASMVVEPIAVPVEVSA